MDTLDLGLAVLRLGVGITFALHGAQKILGWWGGPGITGWHGAMDRMGFLPAGLFAWVSGMIELAGGLLLAAGLATPLAATALLAQSVVIVGHVHWSKGFFNSKGGFEFPLVLAVGLTAVLLAGPGTASMDAVLGMSVGQLDRVFLVIVGVLVGAGVLALPRLRTVTLSGQPR